MFAHAKGHPLYRLKHKSLTLKHHVTILPTQKHVGMWRDQLGVGKIHIYHLKCTTKTPTFQKRGNTVWICKCIARIQMQRQFTVSHQVGLRMSLPSPALCLQPPWWKGMENLMMFDTEKKMEVLRWNLQVPVIGQRDPQHFIYTFSFYPKWREKALKKSLLMISLLATAAAANSYCCGCSCFLCYRC